MSAQIRFFCPTCKAVMNAPVEKAGKKVNCLKCGQRLQIPPAERAKTILAPSLGVDDDPPDRAGGSPPPTAQIAPGPPPHSSSSQATQSTFRGWVIARPIWVTIATCAIVFQVCVGLTSIGIAMFETEKQKQMDPGRQLRELKKNWPAGKDSITRFKAKLDSVH